MIQQIEKLGIFAGSGFLPRHVYDGCQQLKIPAKIIGLEGQTSPDVFRGIEYRSWPVYSISKMLRYLRQENIRDIVLAGKVSRSFNLSKLLFDINGAKLLAQIMRHGLSDNSILSAIIKFLEDEDFRIWPPEIFAQNIVFGKGPLTKCLPNKHNWADIRKGMKILQDIAMHDIGQALVIQSGLVLGVEAAEGTDNLIIRCGQIKQAEEGGPVLLKAVKPNQDRRVDLPCLGCYTIQQLYLSGFSGVAVEAGSALLLEGEKTIKEANDKGVFIYGV